MTNTVKSGLFVKLALKRTERKMMQFEENFFKAEIRNSFKISSMMKRAWAAEMEVLEVVIDICNRNGIKYFADWGTLLGAVRHGGFIPWDDDIDICLLRDDYNRLIKALKTDLPYGFVMAGMYSESVRLQEAAFVPNIRVIADETMWNFNDYMVRFHGFPYQRIGIDIFPLDKITDNVEDDEKQCKDIKTGATILQNWKYMEDNNILEKELFEFEKSVNAQFVRDKNIKNNIWRKIDSISMQYEEKDYENVADIIFYLDKKERKCKREWFEYAIPMRFENIEIMVPNGYDEILKRYYGNYKEFVKGGNAHSYPFYKHMQKELVKQIRGVGFRGSVDSFCELVSKGKLRV